MTTKEYAKKLVDSFRSYVDSEINGETDFVYSKEQETYNAKQCAIICIDEMLKLAPFYDLDINCKSDHLQIVRQEIEKL